MADTAEVELKGTNGDASVAHHANSESELKDNEPNKANTSAKDAEGGTSKDIEKTSVINPAPQAQDDAEVERQSSLDGMEDCKLTPQDADAQRQSMKDALEGKNFPAPSLADNSKQENHVHFSENVETQSSLHADDYTNRQSLPHNPNNHESALHSDPSTGGGGATNGTLDKIRRKNPRLTPGQGKKSHSHPRKSPFRSEIAKLREQQRLAKEKKGITGKTVGLAATTAPPDTASFAKQAEKVKHNILQSLGEFLTGAFADDEELSGSYYSQELLDQIQANDPTVKGVWLQAKSLNDTHVQKLCEVLIRNRIITEVWLPQNQITDVGAGYIAHMLKFNHSIKELFLGKNEIGPKGAAALAAALARGNNTLVALGLGDNHIGVEGAGAFAAALRHNHMLTSLDIKNNDIPRYSSIRGLLHKMLEFNAADPGDESLVSGLQEELGSLISNLPPDVAEDIVLQAEEALKMAMMCRKRGDVVGAAEAEGIFIRICTTGEAPVDPPEEMANAVRQQQKLRPAKSKMTLKKPSEPDRLGELNGELNTLKFHDQGEEDSAGEGKTFEEVLTERDTKSDDNVATLDTSEIKNDELPEVKDKDAGEEAGCGTVQEDPSGDK